jgi:DDE superfamily endonuclease
MIGAYPLLQIDIRKQLPRSLVRPPHRVPPSRHTRRENHDHRQTAIPNNLARVPLPAHSPELNPVERIWLYLRERFLSPRFLPDTEAMSRRVAAPGTPSPPSRVVSAPSAPIPIMKLGS